MSAPAARAHAAGDGTARRIARIRPRTARTPLSPAGARRGRGGPGRPDQPPTDREAGMTEVPISTVWPSPDTAPMGDPALIEAYTPPDGPWLRVNFVTSIDGAVELDGYSEG